MDRELLTQRLADVGLDDTVAADPQHTLRGTLPFTSEPSFPLLSVDLRLNVGQASNPSTSDLEVRDVIGEGGMGRVLLARQHSLRRDVAVKTAKPGASAAVRRAILEEGAVTGQLEHPAIVPVHALGVDGEGNPAMVMKRVEGVSWSALIADPNHALWDDWEGGREDRLPGHLQILMAICNAVHFAHSRGIVHRDIKPDNVLIGGFGDVYLADWGVATEVGDEGGALRGTPAFMAPEMALGGRIDERTDVYLLGATLYMVLSGEPIHGGRTLSEILFQAAQSEPVTLADVPAELAALVRSACHVDPERRPSTAQRFRDALREFMRHRDSHALTEGACRRVERVVELDAMETLDEGTRAELDAAVTEARFGLQQALELWSDNRAASEALDTLQRVVAARRARVAELEQRDFERNPHVGARSRAVVITGVSLATFGVAASGLLIGRLPTPSEAVIVPTLVLVAYLVLLWRVRQDALRNQFNRNAAFMVGTAIALMVVGRVVGLFEPVAVHEHLIRDAFMLGGVFFVAAITLVRWAVWPGVLSIINGVLCTLYRPHALRIFSGIAVVIGLSLIYFVWRDGRAAQERTRS